MNIKRIICSLFGHNWKTHLTTSQCINKCKNHEPIDWICTRCKEHKITIYNI